MTAQVQIEICRDDMIKEKLSNLYDIGSSKRVFQSEWRDQGVPFYRAREIAKLSVDGFVDNELFIDEQLYEEYTAKYGKPEPGDVMVTGVGTLGVCYVVKQGDRFYFKDGNILWFKQKAPNRILPEYLVKAFSSKEVKDYISKNSSGTTVGTFTIQVANKMEISLPSLTQQQDIIQRISKLEGIIKGLNKEIELLDQLVKARFVELFGNVQKEEKYAGIRLGNLCTTINGGTPSTKHPEYYEGDIPWISTVSLGPNHIDGSTAKGFITQEAIDNSATKLIPAGNILFGTRVGVGKSSLNDVDICTNQDIVAIIGIDESKYNRLFIKHVLDSYQSYFDSIKKGATILGITADDLKNALIPEAPIAIQLEFEKFVDQVDKSKSVVQKSLDEAQVLFDSLMQEYFG